MFDVQLEKINFIQRIYWQQFLKLCHQKLLPSYEIILSHTKDFLSTFSFDNIAEEIGVITYMLNRGYFSYKHVYQYQSQKAYITIPTFLWGSIVCGGYGVCRHESALLMDILKKEHISSYQVITHLPICEKYDDSLELIRLSLFKYYHDIERGGANHVLTYINDLSFPFCYDITNHEFYSIVNHYFLECFTDENRHLPIYLLTDFSKNYYVKKCPFSKIEEEQKEIMRKSYQKGIHVCDKNQDYLDHFYQENKENYFILAENIRKQKKFQKRLRF